MNERKKKGKKLKAKEADKGSLQANRTKEWGNRTTKEKLNE